jgi:Tfp pilus assembly protein PilX
MKIQKPFQRSKSGGVLLMAMLVMLAFSILAIGLYQMSATNAVETVYHSQLSQAFWEAESGLQDAVQRLASSDDTFRKSAVGKSASFSVTNDTDQTGYTVIVTDSLEGNVLSQYYEFDVVSTGWKGGMSRNIQQRLATQPGFISAIMAPGNIDISANTLVSGPIMVLDDGHLTMADTIPPGQNEEGDFDTIILDNDATMQTTGGSSQGDDFAVLDLSVPDNLPSMPDYSAYQDSANLVPAIPGATNMGIVALTGDLYLNFPDGVTITKITGSGTIVNTGDITINGSTVTGGDVSSDVEVLSFGSIDIGQKTDFDGNTLIYAFETVEFGDGSYMAGNSAILADGGTAGEGVAERILRHRFC